MNIGWPESIMLGIIVFSLLVTAMVEGEPKTGKHSLALKMLDAIITLGLLYWGGFFD